MFLNTNGKAAHGIRNFSCLRKSLTRSIDTWQTSHSINLRYEKINRIAVLIKSVGRMFDMRRLAQIPSRKK